MALKKETKTTSKVVSKAASTKKAAPAKKAAPVKKAEPKAKKTAGAPVAHGVGRRKTSVARAWVRKGSGNLTVNETNYKDYFDTDLASLDAYKALSIAPAFAQAYDVDVTVKGGGYNSQAGATRLAVARAFVELNEAIRPLMREYGLLTVDSRVKERKKYGQKAARRKFQFVKR